MSSRIRSRGALLALLALSALAACVDPKNRFDEFNDRVVDAGQVDRDGGGGLFEIDGEFLLSISVVIAPDNTVRFIATSDINIEGGAGTLTLSFQPLKVDQCQPTGNGGTEVGDPLAANDLGVDAAGVFQLTHDGASVDGKANPISCSEIVADLVLDGVIQSEDLFCGDVSGQAHQPLDISLDGSTFGAIRIEPGTRGDANLPEPVTSCP